MTVTGYRSLLVVDAEVLISYVTKTVDELSCVLDAGVVFVDSILESLDVLVPLKIVLDSHLASLGLVHQVPISVLAVLCILSPQV
jgi:hypothetical protein